MDYNIINSATYLIQRFHEQKEDLLELKLQKMLYFAEAFYMHSHDTKNLFKEKWLAKPNGPMNKEVHETFKNEGLPIDMKKIDFSKANYVNNELKEFLDNIFELFRSVSTSVLVELTRSDGSPWSEISKKMSGVDLLNNENKFIIKSETKKWIGKIAR